MAIKREDLLLFMWEYNSLYFSNILSTSSQKVEVVDCGTEQFKDGESCFTYDNATFIVDGEEVVGRVKIASSLSSFQRWVVRNPQEFDSIKLLVVGSLDIEIELGEEMVVVEKTVSGELYRRFTALSMSSRAECADFVCHLNSLNFADFIDNLLIDRIEYKLNILNASFNKLGQDYNTLALFTLFDTVMIGTENRTVMVALFNAIKQNTIVKNLDTIEQVEALILGSSGVLEQNSAEDEYIFDLRKRFSTIKKEYRISPLPPSMWYGVDFTKNGSKWALLAQIAAILFKHKNLAAAIGGAKDVKALEKLLETQPSRYWLKKVFPKLKSDDNTKSIMSQKRKERVIINGFIPFYGFYNYSQASDDYINIRSNMADMLMNTAPEENSIVNKWSGFDVPINSAATSQALIHTNNNYCKHKLCHKCYIGRRILKGL